MKQQMNKIDRMNETRTLLKQQLKNKLTCFYMSKDKNIKRCLDKVINERKIDGYDELTIHNIKSIDCFNTTDYHVTIEYSGYSFIVIIKLHQNSSFNFDVI